MLLLCSFFLDSHRRMEINKIYPMKRSFSVCTGDSLGRRNDFQTRSLSTKVGDKLRQKL